MRGILRRGRSGGGGRWPGRALVALAAGLAFTAAIVAALVDSTAARDRSLFEENARAAQDAVTDRVETAIALLRGAAGLFASQRESVPYEAFRAYMARVALREQYPGILGIGYTRRIAPDELAAVTAQARAEGQAGFRVWPADERAEYHAILFLEPLDERNRAAIGYDMSTNPVRRAAMERARDQGAASASGMVELVQEIDSRKQPGFLIYLPVYRGGVVPAGVEARREALVGYVYAPIRGGDFLSSAFAHETVPRVALRVFHGRGEAGGVMIYEHAPPDAPEAPRFTLRSTADVAGQAWTFVASSATSAAAGLAVPAMIAAAGILLSVTLAALLWRDATARDAIQVALSREQAARSQAERANRMKDDFLATLSHELRTPLNAIVGWAAVLRQGRISEAQAQAGIEAIDRNAKAQARLIDDLLDMNRIVSGKLRVDLGPLDPVPVVDEAIAAVLPTARDKGVRLERQFAGEPLRVRADASRLRQIAWNLLTNAVKFTPQGGEVRVTLDRDGARARLAVRDTGAGIEPAFLAHVFDRFAQGDSTITRHHGGLGLGLAIVRELVALHGGEVRALSDGPGQGATFVVTLPLADPVPAASDPAAATGAKLGGLRVLVVDDEPDVRDLLRLLLEQRDARVRCAASAEEALALLPAFRPDVVVSDIGMPGGDGYALMRRIRALPPHRGGDVPAAALTAYARDEDRREAFAAGFQRHLVKPVQPDVLVTTVLELARGRGDATRVRPASSPG